MSRLSSRWEPIQPPFVQREHLRGERPIYFVQNLDRAQRAALARLDRDNGFVGPGAKQKAEKLLRDVLKEVKRHDNT